MRITLIGPTTAATRVEYTLLNYDVATLIAIGDGPIVVETGSSGGWVEVGELTPGNPIAITAGPFALSKGVTGTDDGAYAELAEGGGSIVPLDPVSLISGDGGNALVEGTDGLLYVPPGGGSGGVVDQIDEGTGIEVDATVPAAPVVGLSLAAIASLSLADSAVQPGDDISGLTNDAGYTTNAGTVTSVGLSVPTGLQVSGSPVTASGSIAVAYTAGYVGYTTTEQTKLAGIASGAQVNTVTSVNGDVGTVVLTHADVGAAPAAGAPVVTLTGTAYGLHELTAGAWHEFTAAGAVTITVLDDGDEPIAAGAEFGLMSAGAGGVSLVSDDAAVIVAPMGGSLELSEGHAAVLKRRAADSYKLLGETEDAP